MSRPTPPTRTGRNFARFCAVAIAAIVVVLTIAEWLVWSLDMGFWMKIFPGIGLVLIAAKLAADPVTEVLEYQASKQPQATRSPRYAKAIRLIRQCKRPCYYGAWVFVILAFGAEVVWIIQLTP